MAELYGLKAEQHQLPSGQPQALTIPLHSTAKAVNSDRPLAGTLRPDSCHSK